ncbi:MAG: rRNA pseudouridine synthase [Cyclobacteriaceae bacterium]|nr:rRNA pseudouridine synthase [Cyclobacteriaceae bacterium]
MRKRNTSGPSRGKSNRSSDKKSFDKPSGSRFGKEKRGPSPEGEKRPFRRKSATTSFEKGGEREGRSFDKPSGSRFDKEKRGPSPEGEKRSFKRKSATTSFEKGGERKGRSFDKPKGSGFSKPERRPSSDARSFGKKSSPAFEKGEERRKKFTKPGSSTFSTQPKARRNDEEGEKPRGFFNKQKFNRDKPGKFSSKKEQAPTIANLTGKIRLNRYVANSGICSRREADERIKLGLVSVNGAVITEMGFLVSPGDEVRYESKKLQAERPVYLLMNKPKGYLTTTKDPQERNTVMHIIGSAVKERIYPVGRLDRNTTGLLLFTNDGELAERLSHPSYNVKKIYKVELDRPLSRNDFQKIQEGVQLEEGRAVVDDLAIVSDDGKTVGIELHIGWNRVVRRIFEKLEYTVIKLDRSVYAGLDKKDLPRGHWRFLTKEEIVRLKHFK